MNNKTQVLPGRKDDLGRSAKLTVLGQILIDLREDSSEGVELGNHLKTQISPTALGHL